MSLLRCHDPVLQPGWLKEGESPHFWRLEVQGQGVSRACSFPGLQGRVWAVSFQLLEASGAPYLQTTIVPLCLYALFPLQVPVFHLPLVIRTPVPWGQGLSPLQCGCILTHHIRGDSVLTEAASGAPEVTTSLCEREG